ncbi:MAG: branched-chain amino acid ABC transporter permease [Deltaproteobacteria bacterium]|nr:branched-chain amino acid ABC transporter permease [Deltaproteobacteria bacterium]
MTEFIQQLINGLAWGSIYALIALGYTMVYGILRLINFAHGEVYMIGAMTGYYAVHWGMGTGSLYHLLAVICIAMLVCSLLGWAIERAAYRPMRQAPRLNVLITAIGVSLFLQFSGQYIFGADPKPFPALIENKNVLDLHGVVLSNIQVTIFVSSIVLMLGLRYIVFNTQMGKAMRAVSYDHTASYLVGINVNRVISFTFILGSALAGAAGILVGLSNPTVNPLMGLMPGIKAFIAAVLGGIGNIPGALIGGLIMGVAETMVSGYLSGTYRDALAFIILIIILVVRPQGLLGKSTQEKV